MLRAQRLKGTVEHEDGNDGRCYQFHVSLAISLAQVLLSMFMLLHSNDDISLFVPLVNIPVSLDDLLQGITSINDRFDLACFNQFFQEDEILRLWSCFSTYERLAACHSRKDACAD
ncbi:hypothetical protein KSF_099790 [Reticulibacter mediterranei]|uniref:Uncharacterized protein n=1 Tax=Reticulibacter mediterranei TaxID=2778369 RepID=A0A8J3J1K6_9CHLR|nr:hypothetical protein KSF_099790 [Reticulibacter mediterranei]